MLPLGTVIAENFMAELDRSLLLMLSSYMTSWKRYVDDTIDYVKTDTIEHVLFIGNWFHWKILFIYQQEIEKIEKPPSLTS